MNIEDNPLAHGLRWIYRSCAHFHLFPTTKRLLITWNGPGCELEVRVEGVTEENLPQKFIEVVQMAMDKDRKFWTRMEPGTVRPTDLMDAMNTTMIRKAGVVDLLEGDAALSGAIGEDTEVGNDKDE